MNFVNPVVGYSDPMHFQTGLQGGITKISKKALRFMHKGALTRFSLVAWTYLTASVV
jgi:hypothetical protein